MHALVIEVKLVAAVHRFGFAVREPQRHDVALKSRLDPIPHVRMLALQRHEPDGSGNQRDGREERRQGEPDCLSEGSSKLRKAEVGSALEKDHDQRDGREGEPDAPERLRAHDAEHRSDHDPEDREKQHVWDEGSLEQRREEMRQQDEEPKRK